MTTKETAAEIMLRRSNTKPETFPVNPRIKTTAPVGKIYQQTTAGSSQKSEASYQKILDRAVNIPGNDRPTSRK
jgi:hypothetical protein